MPLKPKLFPFHLRLILILSSLFLFILFGLIAVLAHLSNPNAELHEDILNEEFSIRNFPLFAEEYVKQGNRKQLLILKREADHIHSQLEEYKEKKSFHQHMEDYPTPFEDEKTQLTLGLQAYQNEFLAHYEYINELWAYNLSNLRSKHSNLSASERKEKLNKTLNFLQRRNTTLIRKNRNFRTLIKNRKIKSEVKTRWIVCFVTLSSLIGFLYLYYIVIEVFLKRLRKEQRQFAQIVGASTDEHIEVIEQLSNTRIEIEEKLSHSAQYIQQISKLNFDQSMDTSQDWLLGKALRDMVISLKSMAKEKEINSWTNEGFSLISDILNQNTDDVHQLSYEFIRFLCKYCELNQGIVFLNTAPHDAPIKLAFSSCYAYGHRKNFENHELPQQGLISQVIKEKMPLYIEEIPEDYIGITSGLGKAPPRSIMICPLYDKEEFFGTIEVASFRVLHEGYQDFIKNACEKFSNTLSVYQINQTTKELLTSTKEQNALLQEKEKEMGLFAQELQDTQGQLGVKLLELRKESNLTKNIIDAIDKSSATIEFDPQGKILKVNDMFLSIMGYTPTELIGKYESVLVSPSEANSQRYQLMWTGLSTGSFMTGEFKRLTNKGKDVWMSATYNPIFDLDGKTVKIIMLASFITEEREKSLDYNLRITAFNNHLHIVELDQKGKMKKANPNFEKLTGYKRADYRDCPLADLLTTEREMARIQSKIKKVMTEKQSLSEDCQLRNSEKKEISIRIHLYPIYNLTHAVMKVVAILTPLNTESAHENVELLE